MSTLEVHSSQQLTPFVVAVQWVQVDNLSYHYGLSEREKERVDTYGHIMLTDAEAKKLSRTKVLVVAVTMVATVWLVLNASLPAACFGVGFVSPLLFKVSELISMHDAPAKEKVILGIKAFVTQVLSTLIFILMGFPVGVARF